MGQAVQSVHKIAVLLCAIHIWLGTYAPFNYYESSSFPQELKNGDWMKSIQYISKDVFVLKKYTVQFKITHKGYLESLTFSENTPLRYRDSVRTQLTRLNGHWSTASANTSNNWFVFHHYDFGTIDYSGRSGHIPANVHSEYEVLSRQLEAEKTLFDFSNENKSSIRYIKTEDGYLFKPFVSISAI